MTTTPQRWPVHDADEVAAVTQVLQSGATNYWTGENCRAFEEEYAAFIGTRYAIAMMNGTVALEAALHALEIGPGDEIITSCRTFIASASCIVACGATPVLADVDPISQNMSVDTIAPLINARTKALIVVHLAGWPADMQAILALAKQHGLKVIEDCAQAHGATLHGKKVGSFGDVAAFSFCQDKILTTGGEGGMVTTNNAALWEKMWSYKDHGKGVAVTLQTNHPPGFRWLHDSFGSNFRMTEMQAAIGRLQLKKLPAWLKIRQDHAAILTQALKAHPALTVTAPPAHVAHAFYKYYVFLCPQALRSDWDRDRIMQTMNARGIPCFTGSCSDIGREKAFARFSTSAVTRPHAARLGETSLMFLVDPTRTQAETEQTAAVLLAVLQEATHAKCDSNAN